jgi:Fur family peroxide stress response transcriptional regulator
METMRKQKHSDKRAAILEALRTADNHPSAECLYQKLKSVYPSLSLGTVYRNLAEFKNAGLIRIVAVVNGQERYDGDLTEHDHFICEKCAVITPIYDTQPYAGREKLEKKGFEIRSRRVHIYGLCPACVQKAARGPVHGTK